MRHGKLGEKLSALTVVLAIRCSYLQRYTPLTEGRKYVILFAATILAARKLAEIGDRPCPAREACIADAITKAELILRKIEQRFGGE
jgi:hypothetical protein